MIMRNIKCFLPFLLFLYPLLLLTSENKPTRFLEKLLPFDSFAAVFLSVCKSCRISQKIVIVLIKKISPFALVPSVIASTLCVVPLGYKKISVGNTSNAVLEKRLCMPMPLNT